MIRGLRTGNYVGSGNGIYKIYAISVPQILALQDYKEDKDSEEKVFSADNTIINPINIDENWLLKFGFKIGNQCYKNGYSKEILKTDFYLRPSFRGGYYWGFNIDEKKLDCELNDVKPLEYVHELQNLFFAITGTELELKHECSTCG